MASALGALFFCWGILLFVLGLLKLPPFVLRVFHTCPLDPRPSLGRLAAVRVMCASGSDARFVVSRAVGGSHALVVSALQILFEWVSQSLILAATAANIKIFLVRLNVMLSGAIGLLAGLLGSDSIVYTGFSLLSAFQILFELATQFWFMAATAANFKTFLVRLKVIATVCEYASSMVSWKAAMGGRLLLAF